MARVADKGPIVGSVRVSGFRLISGPEANYGVVETSEDGTELIEMGLVLSPVLPEVSVHVKLVVGGVVFEEGTVTKVYYPGDFNPLGEAQVRFLRPAIAKTSVCHRLTARQGLVELGGFW